MRETEPGPTCLTGALAVVVLGAVASACTTIDNLLRLRDVDFSLERVSDARLAGVDLDRVRSVRDVAAGDVLRVAEAIARGEVPFDFVLHVGAENPGDNPVEVERVQLDWTLYLQDRETVSGVFDRALEIGPGGESDLPIDVSLDLYRFFRDDARDLLALARELVGTDGAPASLELRARPTVWRPLGPIRYPGEITIDASGSIEPLGTRAGGVGSGA